MTLTEIKNVYIRMVDSATLAPASDVNINMDFPKEARMRDFIRQTRNPYCLRSGRNGSVAVKISYADTPVSLNERMENYLRTL